MHVTNTRNNVLTEQYLHFSILRGFRGMHEHLGFNFRDFIMLSKQIAAIYFCLCVLPCSRCASCLEVQNI